MDSDAGGQTPNSQRQAATEIARKKVLAAYAGMSQNSDNVASAPNAAAQPGMTSPYAAPNNPHMKDEPINPRINSEFWKRYHSAWQDYYQKYYSEYYSNAARQYIAKEQLKVAREQAEDESIAMALARANGKNDKKSGLSLGQNIQQNTEDSLLRTAIRKKATDSAKKSRKFRKFIPLMAGLAVTLTILFLQYNRLIFAPIYAYVSPGNAPASEIEAIDPTVMQTVSPDPRLIIPKLNIDVPVRFDVNLSDIMAAMNTGVAHYRIAGASAYPGEIGNFIVTGHSAGDVYSANPYKYIFSGLERLENGDLIYMNYNSVRYTYQVTKKEVVEPSDVDALIVQTDKPIITLVTCTPLGTSRYRLLVTGEQISPNFDNADVASEVSESVVGGDMPSNEPSFFERIWNFLTGN